MQFIKIIQIFDRAAENLSFPKIREIHIDLDNSEPLTLHRYTQGKTPGAVSVNDLSGEWFGKITRDGKFYPSRNCPSWIKPALKLFCENPEKIAADSGKLNGRCCFCNRKLTDERSLSVGYGAICADNYGLSWGETKLSTERIVWEQWVQERCKKGQWSCDYETWKEMITIGY